MGRAKTKKTPPAAEPLPPRPAVFLKISQIGRLDAEGKMLMYIGYKRRFVSQEGKPLSSLVIPALEKLSQFIEWDSAEQAKADVALLQRYVASWAENIKRKKGRRGCRDWWG